MVNDGVKGISSTINEVVSGRPSTVAETAPARKKKKDRSRDRGDLIYLSDLAQNLHTLIKFLEEKDWPEEQNGFDFIMEKFIENPDPYPVPEFVEMLVELSGQNPGCFKELLFQARMLQKDDYNPILWLGVLTRLSRSEAESFIECTAEIFSFYEDKDLVRELVAYIEEVRKILNKHQFREAAERSAFITSACRHINSDKKV